jgi:hypothetical protein
VPYLKDIFDCENFGNLLFDHLCRYYGINSVIPVWGDTTAGYHGFNLVVMRDAGNNLIARLIEPQSDNLFVSEGPLGHYVPKMTALELGVLNKPVIL